MSLKEYDAKRNFSNTPEPPGDAPSPLLSELRFVVHKHAATRLHYDLRLEFDGSYKSWAVPNGIPLNPVDRQLAVHVEDHPLAYGNFEGIIPAGNYGAGTVMLWDYGLLRERTVTDIETARTKLLQGFNQGKLTFLLDGQKLKGEFALIQLQEDPKNWLLLKKSDSYCIYSQPEDRSGWDQSALSGRSMDEIAQLAAATKSLWIPGKTAGEKAIVTPPWDKLTFTIATGAKKLPLPKIPPEQFGAGTWEDMGETPYKSPPKSFQEPVRGYSYHRHPDWLVEAPLTGLRCYIEIQGFKEHPLVKFLGKTGPLKLPPNDFAQAIAAMEWQKLPVVLDAELGCFRGDGSFRGVRRPGEVAAEELFFRIIDVLWWGSDGRDLPLEERLLPLKTLKLKWPLVTLDGLGTPPESGEEASEMLGADQLLLRHRLSSHQRGRSKSWLQWDHPKKTVGQIPLTNQNKVLWREEKRTKGDLVAYYDSVADYILPYLIDRPQSMHRHPNGIDAPGFFHKDASGYLPRFVETTTVYSEHGGKSIRYLLCQNKQTLLYMANLGCIEINPWFAKVPHLDQPDFVVVDLDPGGQSFAVVREAAQVTVAICEARKIPYAIKTSGSKGIHIGIPVQGGDFDQAREFARNICLQVEKELPDKTTLERNPDKRAGKLYLDYMQNRRGQTLASVYCVRSRPGAPVSMPITKAELQEEFLPGDFHLGNALARIKAHGDLWLNRLGTLKVDLAAIAPR